MATYTLKGMHCNHCEMLVAAELEDRGAKDVHADHTTGVVTFSGEIPESVVREAVEAAGFELER